MTIGDNNFSFVGNSIREIGWEELAQLVMFRDALDRNYINKAPIETFSPLGDYFTKTEVTMRQNHRNILFDHSQELTKKINELTKQLAA